MVNNYTGLTGDLQGQGQYNKVALGQCAPPKMETLYDVSQSSAKMADEIVIGLGRLSQHFQPTPETASQNASPGSGHLELANYTRNRIEEAARILRNIIEVVGA